MHGGFSCTSVRVLDVCENMPILIKGGWETFCGTPSAVKTTLLRCQSSASSSRSSLDYSVTMDTQLQVFCSKCKSGGLHIRSFIHPDAALLPFDCWLKCPSGVFISGGTSMINPPQRPGGASNTRPTRPTDAVNYSAAPGADGGEREVWPQE